MLQVIQDSQSYTSIDQVINALKVLSHNIDYPKCLSRAALQEEIKYIMIGINNSKENGVFK